MMNENEIFDVPSGLTAEFHTLGCKLNYAETSQIAAMLSDRGIERVTPGEEPALIIVNTCSVTAEADKKCRHLIRHLGRRYPEAAIIVTGCYSQLKSQEVASLPGVAVIAGNDSKGQILEYVNRWMADRQQVVNVREGRKMEGFTHACSRGDRTRYFLKVQDGCDYFCTYCTIPLARGRSRSPRVNDIVPLARKVAAEGGKEIVLTGVNIGDFGKGSDETFFDLIKALDGVEGIERYRISSIEPNLLTDEMIEWCSTSSKFMPHFHIPLQAGTDEVLKLMHRHYDTALFRHRIETIRHFIPDAFIGVDLIVGARGETRELFEQSKKFVESLDISRLHIFPYSERPGTRALSLEACSVDKAEKHRRVGEMKVVSDAKLKAFTSRFIGTMRPVLVEHTLKGDTLGGFTDNYLRVTLPAEYAAHAGSVIEAEIKDIDADATIE